MNAGNAPQLLESRLRSGRMSDSEEQHSHNEPNLESLVEQLQAENEQLRRQKEVQLRELQRAGRDISGAL